MPTTADIINNHATNIAYVAEMSAPATDLAEFTRHLDYAADNFDQAGINGHEDLKTAGTLLDQATEAEGPDREALLLRAATLIRIIPDITDEYRDMVGD
ncbi:hypothetical protein SUDANB145_07232 (plasmid) [Streptomyces sp. enrichment culture]|uniref:hypothetical protein n=1 Tax=Streptomyces sp. enrichment culture TaxID=1795815 RepID=UPI003F575AC8